MGEEIQVPHRGFTQVRSEFADDESLRTVVILANRRGRPGRHRAKNARSLTEESVRQVVFDGAAGPSGLDPETIEAARRIAAHIARFGHGAE